MPEYTMEMTPESAVALARSELVKAQADLLRERQDKQLLIDVLRDALKEAIDDGTIEREWANYLLRDLDLDTIRGRYVVTINPRFTIEAETIEIEVEAADDAEAIDNAREMVESESIVDAVSNAVRGSHWSMDDADDYSADARPR